MRFTREKLLKNISEKQLRQYQKEQGYAPFSYPRKELTINEMVKELYWHFTFSAHMSFGKHYDPVAYLNRVDTQRRIALDISRCLVTAKKLGEEIECSGATPDNIFEFMMADLSSHARCLSDKALRADFGCGYQEAAFTVYEEVTALIRRLKLTREGFNAIQALPGAVLCDAPKALPAAEEDCKESAETAKAEKNVRPERAIAPMTTAIKPAADDTETESAVEEKSEPERKEDMFPKRLLNKWKSAKYDDPQPYELISPYDIDSDEDFEDEEEDERYDSSTPQKSGNLWKELFREEERISTELAAIKSQLSIGSG